jgi:hypothetical protein
MHTFQDLLVCRILNDAVSVTVIILHVPLEPWWWRHNPSKRWELPIKQQSITAQKSGFSKRSLWEPPCLCLLLHEIWRLCCATLMIFTSLWSLMLSVYLMFRLQERSITHHFLWKTAFVICFRRDAVVGEYNATVTRPSVRRLPFHADIAQKPSVDLQPVICEAWSPHLQNGGRQHFLLRTKIIPGFQIY